MSKRLTKTLFAVLLLLFGSQASDSIAGEQKAGYDNDNSAELVANVDKVAIVWLKPGGAKIKDLVLAAESFSGGKEKVIAIYGKAGDETPVGFAVQLTPAEAVERFNQLRNSGNSLDNDFADSIDHIERDGIVQTFDDSICNQSTTSALPGSEMTTAKWMTRINAPLKPLGTNFKATVWVIDSGISTDYDDTGSNPELHVDRANSAVCDASGCVAGGNGTNDRLGHGTMIAGIIGAKKNGTWFVGVAPNVALRAIKIFKNKPKIDWVIAYQGVVWVMGKAVKGDVVNISWGGPWDPDAGNRRAIEGFLQAMADKGVRVSVAAGNSDVLKGSGYVQTISPARAGAYRPANTLGGAVVTASAFDSNNDSFWPYSAFGNGQCTGTSCGGPPDFAEPGADIASLWPGLVQNTCSGTSFSAAFLSGILVQGLPKPDHTALNDPDDVDPVTQTVVPANDDPIGVCTQSADLICHEP